jgi:hypothetical protein
MDDAYSWDEIWLHNAGRLMADGRYFVNPRKVHSRWQIVIPAAPQHFAARHRLGLQRRMTTERQPSSNVPTLPTQFGRELPQLLALGASTLTVGLLARRYRIRMYRNRRHRSDAAGHDDQRVNSEGALDCLTLLAPFTNAPLIDWLLAADFMMGEHYRDRTRPQVLAANLTDEGLRLFVRPHKVTPPAFVILISEGVWHIPGRVLSESSDLRLKHRQPFSFAYIPIADDESGFWAIPLMSGQTVSLVGKHSIRLLDEAEVCLLAQDGIVIDRRAGVSGHEIIVRQRTGTDHSSDILGRVTANGGAWGNELTVVADEFATSIHPLGVVLQPLRPIHDSLRELVEGETPRPSIFQHSRQTGGRSTIPHGEPVVAEPHTLSPAQLPKTPARGAVMVRILTSVPRIDGLAMPLEQKRSRRAVEVVAYLAQHFPHPITGDRLRTRVLGSEDSDAAAKTLFNVMSCARRALGNDANGEPLLPTGSRDGLYRLSRVVRLDAGVATDLISQGLRSSGTEGFELLRQGLELIETEPLSSQLAGYTWWHTEGHERKFAAAVLAGAEGLASLSLDSGRLDVARWSVDQARLVDPWAEQLDVLSLRIAFASGSPEAVQREWRECCRRAKELDEEGVPGPGLRDLYHSLVSSLTEGKDNQAKFSAPADALAQRSALKLT